MTWLDSSVCCIVILNMAAVLFLSFSLFLSLTIPAGSTSIPLSSLSCVCVSLSLSHTLKKTKNRSWFILSFFKFNRLAEIKRQTHLPLLSLFLYCSIVVYSLSHSHSLVAALATWPAADLEPNSTQTFSHINSLQLLLLPLQLLIYPASLTHTQHSSLTSLLLSLSLSLSYVKQ